MNIDFKKIFPKKNIKRSPHLSFFRTPRKVWHAILVLFLCMTIILSGISLYLLNQISAGIFIVPSIQPNPAQLINHEKLDAILNQFDNRTKKLEELKTTSPSIIDPSL